jgi:uncharacterized protein YlxW (UPF0749 family)
VIVGRITALEGGGLVDDHTLWRIDVALVVFALGFALAAVTLAGHHAERERRRLLLDRNRIVRESDEESEQLRAKLQRLQAELDGDGDGDDGGKADPDEWGGVG